MLLFAQEVALQDVANVEGYVSGFGVLAAQVVGLILSLTIAFFMVEFGLRAIDRYFQMLDIRERQRAADDREAEERDMISQGWVWDEVYGWTDPNDLDNYDSF